MDPISIAAASGMKSRLQALDVLANNIANASATAYKADREWYSTWTGDSETLTQPVVQDDYTDFSQGNIHPTGNPLDAAITGEGMFTVRGRNQILYTRAGEFKLGKDGTLTTKDGYPILTADNQTVKLDPQQPFEISKTGSVTQQGQAKGSIQLVRFPNAQALSKVGSNYYAWAPPTGTASTKQASYMPQKAEGAEVQQGALEQANVQPAENAVRLIQVMRQFEFMQKATGIAGEMNRKAVEEVARVSN